MNQMDHDWFDRVLSISHKWGLLLAAVSGIVIVAAAIAYEKITGVMPCQLCWLQRWIFIALAAVCLAAFLLVKAALARKLTGLLLLLITLIGVAIASRHLYIKMNPELVSCGMDVETLLALFPLREAIGQMLIGSSDCAVAADLLGIPLPTWSIIGYVSILVLSIYSLSGCSRTS